MYNLFKYLEEKEGKLISIYNLIKLYDKENLNINLADEVKELIDKGIDPSDYDNYAIRYASINGHTEVVKLLLQDDRVKDSLTREEYLKYKSEVSS